LPNISRKSCCTATKLYKKLVLRKRAHTILRISLLDPTAAETQMITGNQIELRLSERPKRRWLGVLLLIGLSAIGGYAAGGHKASSPEAAMQQSAAIPLEPVSDEDPNNDGD
jgi:hypothetical protein